MAKETLSDTVIECFAMVDAGIKVFGAEDIDIVIIDALTLWRLSGESAMVEAGLMGLYRPLTDASHAWWVED